MTIEPRLATDTDIRSGGLDLLIDNNRNGDVSLAHDKIVIIGPPDRPLGCLVWRPVAWIHEFRMNRNLVSRRLAVRMTDFAIAQCLGDCHKVRSVAFNATNPAMLRLAHDYSATEQPGSLFTVKL